MNDHHQHELAIIEDNIKRARQALMELGVLKGRLVRFRFEEMRSKQVRQRLYDVVRTSPPPVQAGDVYRQYRKSTGENITDRALLTYLRVMVAEGLLVRAVHSRGRYGRTSSYKVR